MTKPLLSICIPTYNRAYILESALYSLAPQVKSAGEIVELIVSDNYSSDSTARVVEKAQEWGAIRYYRNQENIGAAGNILKLTNELANGEFAWILGDDDLVRPDGIRRVLDVLQTYPEIDYVFVNTTPKSKIELFGTNGPVSGADFPELLPTKSKNLIDHYVEHWEQLIDPDIDDVFLGALMCSIFRLSRWRSYPLKVKAYSEPFSSLENSYPHSVILAHTMMGRKAYYIGYPCTLNFDEREWKSYSPLLILVRLQDLLDLYIKLGVDRKQIEKCRRTIVGSSEALKKMLLDSKTPGRQYFSLLKFIWRNRFHTAKLSRAFVGIIYRLIFQISS